MITARIAAPTAMLHFAYASNMSRELMRRHAPMARALGPARLDHHRFIITADGYASVTPARGRTVFGVLWRLTPNDLARLNAYEGLETGLYRACTLPVRAGTQCTSALVYLARSRTEGRPKSGYMDIVLAAAREWGFGDEYVNALAGWARSALDRARATQRGDIV